jgi:predicted Zn-dependent peptidase
MKKSIMVCSALLLGQPKKIAFEEYNLDNGMHVILHHDPTAPVVITSDVPCGVKDETGQNGFPFFEHLLLKEQHIKRGEWFKIVTSNGGTNKTLRMTPIITKSSFQQSRIGTLDGIRKTNAPSY